MKQLIFSFILASYSLIFTVNADSALPSLINKQNIPSLAPLVEKVSPAVVDISVSGRLSSLPMPPDLFQFFNPYYEPEMQQQPFFGLGSGVIINAEKAYIITNYHVIEDASEIKVTLISGQEFIAETIGEDKESDIALLQIQTNTKLTQVEFADSDTLRVGDLVIAIGNPFGLGQTVTSGIISALGRSGLNLDNLENYIQTDAAINSGNSGGALVNLKGELIGINTAVLAPNGSNIGIGFAIPSNMIKNLTEQLLLYGKIRRGVLGIKGQELTAELAETFLLDTSHGVFIKQVSPDSAAEEAGLKAGDIITSLNGTTVNSFAELRAKIGSLTIGTKIELGVIQDGEKVNISATLKEATHNAALAKPVHPYLTGATLHDTGNNKGVRITSVISGSIAESFGLQKDDLIIGINRNQIHNLKELTELLNTSPKLLAVNIERDKRLLYLILD